MAGVLGSILGEVAGSGLSMFNTWNNSSSGWFGRSAGKQDSENAERNTRMNFKYQTRYDQWKSNLDYVMARQYARNSAKWNVEGLMRAGLNPILVANGGGFQGTFGTPSSGSVQSGRSSSGVKSASSAASDAALLSSTARQNELLEAQKENMEAQTEKLRMETKNSAETGGLQGQYGAIHSALTKAGILRSDDDGLWNKIKSHISRPSLGASSPLLPKVFVEKAANVSHSARSSGDTYPMSRIVDALWRNVKRVVRSIGRYGYDPHF